MLGTWLGYYKYDNLKLQKASGFEKTVFTITIISFDEKNFRGTVIDDTKSGGMEETGEILGEVENEKISFIKLMPVSLGIYPTGERKSFDKKHPTLYYSGVFSKDRKEINGIWKFKMRTGFLFGLIPIPYRPGKGTWSMTLSES